MPNLGHARPQPDQLEALWQTLADSGTDTAVSVILKLRGETCDVDCIYCFEKRKEAPGGATITPEQIHHLSRLFGARPLAIELHGGEPLTIGKPKMAAVLDALAAEPTVLRVRMQTNAIQLNASWLDLFDAHYPQLGIGISLDGDEQGNALRVGFDGYPFYRRVVAALDLLAARDRTCGIVTTVTTAVLGRAEQVIDHLAAFPAVRAINLVPAFDTAITRPTATSSTRLPASRQLQLHALTADGPMWAITPAQYADFVLAAASRWISAGYFRRFKLDPVAATIRRLRGVDTSHCHFTNLKCDHIFTLYPGGRLGSCDELPWPQAKLLPLSQVGSEPDITTAQQGNTLLTAGRGLMAKCTTCPYRSTCGGGCTATRWRMIDSTGSDDAYCDHRARLIDGVAALLATPDHREGALCRRAVWRPRTPNEMADPDAFLARWDDATAPRPKAQLRTSGHGNINTAGLPGIHEADDLDPHHPQWRQAIEDRVWPLVDTLTTSWRAVTYDSCQGHLHAGTDEPPSVFRVGLLPRHRAEYAALAARLCRALARAEPYLPPAVTGQLARTDLTTDGRRRPVLELGLVPAPGASWDAYFTALDQASRVLVHAARHTTSDAGCACPAVPNPVETQ